MLRTFTEVKGSTLHASDGEIGSVVDLYFDDESWVLRYLVVDTRRWLPGRKVLISPLSLLSVDAGSGRVDVQLTRDAVKSSPDIDTDKPVSRQHEQALLDYYGYAYYWSGPLLWGEFSYPGAPPPIPPVDAPELRKRLESDERGDPHLRNAVAIIGNRIVAHDGELGRLEELLFDERDWTLPAFVVDARNSVPGGHRIVSTELVDAIDWASQVVTLTCSQTDIKASPEFSPETLHLWAGESGLRRADPPGRHGIGQIR